MAVSLLSENKLIVTNSLATSILSCHDKAKPLETCKSRERECDVFQIFLNIYSRVVISQKNYLTGKKFVDKKEQNFQQVTKFFTDEFFSDKDLLTTNIFYQQIFFNVETI